MAKMLTSETFDKEVTESSLPVLVDFYADWCGPCKAMSPVVEQPAAAEYEGKVKVCKINVDDSQDIAGPVRRHVDSHVHLFQRWKRPPTQRSTDRGNLVRAIESIQ